MSKKFSKALITLAAAGAAVGAGIAYFNKYRNEQMKNDFENFEDDLAGNEEDEQADVPREYVTIPTPSEEKPKEAVSDPPEDGNNDTPDLS